jgi:threonine/homoserine/homoserine lactone efflux protein
MITVSSLQFLTMGVFFGLTAGISPGPLLTLVITETLQHNKTEGIKIAISPLITDIPIIVITYFIFSKFSQFNIVLSLISFLGGIFIAYLGYEAIKSKGLDINVQRLKSDSLKKGVTANFLNPSPYLFWLTIGTPIAFKAYGISLVTVILYFLSFYTLLIGSKICIVLIVERSKTLLDNRAYIWAMRILGITLFIFAIFFFYDGIKILSN